MNRTLEADYRERRPAGLAAGILWREGGVVESTERLWDALVAARQAGGEPQRVSRWVYAVQTTGIYCRPGCRARLPLRRNVRFFAGPAEAEAAGFRACKRCGQKAASSE